MEERIHELLEPAKVSANTLLLKVFHEILDFLPEVMLSEKKRVHLNAGFAIKDCEYEITSGEEAQRVADGAIELVVRLERVQEIRDR